MTGTTATAPTSSGGGFWSQLMDMAGGAVETYGQLYTIDFLNDRGLLPTATAEREIQTTDAREEIAGERGYFGLPSGVVIGGGVVILALVIWLLVKK